MQRHECPHPGPLTTLREFWKDMLLPLLPLYMRLRCQCLSRAHREFARETPWPAWVDRVRQDMPDEAGENLMLMGAKYGFIIEPPIRITDADGIFRVGLEWKADVAWGRLSISIDFKTFGYTIHAKLTRTEWKEVGKLMLDRERRPAVVALLVPPVNVIELCGRMGHRYPQ